MSALGQKTTLAEDDRYGKNAHSVGGADWREEMARALVQ